MTIATNGDIGGFIKRKRVEMGITQAKLANMTGLGLRTVVRIECGDGGTPKLDTLRDIAEALGVELTTLLEAKR